MPVRDVTPEVFRQLPAADERNALKVTVCLDRVAVGRLNTARRRGKIGRDALDRLLMHLGRQVLEAIVEEELAAPRGSSTSPPRLVE